MYRVLCGGDAGRGPGAAARGQELRAVILLPDDRVDPNASHRLLVCSVHPHLKHTLRRA